MKFNLFFSMLILGPCVFAQTPAATPEPAPTSPPICSGPGCSASTPTPAPSATPTPAPTATATPTPAPTSTPAPKAQSKKQNNMGYDNHGLHEDDPTDEATPVPTTTPTPIWRPPTRATPAPTPTPVANENARDVLSYFYKLYPKDSGKPVEGAFIQEQDLKSGYLKVSGFMEGYLVFTLFKSSAEDMVVQQMSNCGPQCDQNFKVFIFKNGKIDTSKKLEDFYTPKQVDTHVAMMMQKLPATADKSDRHRWMRLAKSGRSIEILILDQKPGHTTGSPSVYQAGSLNWTGTKFYFKKMQSLKPVSMKFEDIH